jgi:hypothetical protein
MSNLNNFTLGTVLGWLLGNVPALLAIPGKKIDSAVKSSKESLATLDPPTIKLRKTELRTELLSLRMVIMTLVNVTVLVLLVFSIILGPPRMFGRLIPDATKWVLGATDKLVLIIVIVVHALLLWNQGADSWRNGAKQWVKASQWLKNKTNQQS